MPQVFTNLDASYLANLSSTLGSSPDATWRAISTRLLAISQRLQSMDERSTSAYSRGFSEGQATINQHSNLIPKTGPGNLAEALVLWKDESEGRKPSTVTKVAPKSKRAHSDTLTVADLDLDF